MAQKLSDLVVQEVSLVDVPANGEKRFLIVKRSEDAKGGESVSESVDKSNASTNASATVEKKHERNLLSRIFYAIGKSLGWTDDQVEKACQEATTFSEELQRQRMYKISCELWDYLYALADSISSTLSDDTVDREAVIRASLQQFVETVGNALPVWLSGDTVEKAGKKIAASRLERLRRCRKILDEIIAEAEGSTTNITEGTDSDDGSVNTDLGGGDDMTETQIKEAIKEFLKSEEFQKELEDTVKKALASDDVKKSFSSVEDVLKSEETVKGLAESIANTEVFKNSVQDLTKGLESTMQKIVQHVDVLERNIGISKRLLSDTSVQKSDANFWAGVIPFADKKKISGGEE